MSASLVNHRFGKVVEPTVSGSAGEALTQTLKALLDAGASPSNPTAPLPSFGRRLVKQCSFDELAGWANGYAGGNDDLWLETSSGAFRTGLGAMHMGVTLGGDGQTPGSSAYYRHATLWGSAGSGWALRDAPLMVVRYWQPSDAPTASLTVRLCSAGSSSRNQAFACTASGTEREPGWHYLFKMMDPDYTANSFDATDVTGLACNISGDPGAYVVLDSVQMLRPILVDNRAVFLIRSDDGWLSAYETIAPYIEQYGWTMTLAAVGSMCGETPATGRCSAAQLRELDARGHLIASHSWSHLDWSTLSLAEQEQEVAQNRAFLLKHNLPRGADVLVSPYAFRSRDDAQATMDMVFRYHQFLWTTSQQVRSAAHSGPRLNQGPLLHYLDPRILPANLSDSAVTSSAIDSAISAGGVHTLLIHHVDQGGMTLSAFRSAMDHLRSCEAAGQCRVLSLDEYRCEIARGIDGPVAPTFAAGDLPSSVCAGQIVMDAASSTLKFFDGTQWRTISSS